MQLAHAINLENKRTPNELIFKVKKRNVQQQLKKVVDYLGYENISTHSFRKFFATNLYYDNNNDILLVQEVLQHASAKTTQRYIKISRTAVETALEKNINLI